MPLSAHARSVVEQADGSIVWYAPADTLPASLDAEHQKYICEVFPRLIAEVRAGNWTIEETYIFTGAIILSLKNEFAYRMMAFTIIQTCDIAAW